MSYDSVCGCGGRIQVSYRQLDGDPDHQLEDQGLELADVPSGATAHLSTVSPPESWTWGSSFSASEYVVSYCSVCSCMTIAIQTQFVVRQSTIEMEGEEIRCCDLREMR